MVVENGHFWVVCRNVSVELLLIEIPLDTVEAVSLEIIVTLENGLVAFQSMRRYDGVGKEFDTSTTWKKRKYFLKRIFTKLFSIRTVLCSLVHKKISPSKTTQKRFCESFNLVFKDGIALFFFFTKSFFFGTMT